MASLRERFLTYLCQTSSDPIGIEVASAEGCIVTDTAGRDYLDFISGIGVANVGHRHPAVLDAIRAQIDRYLHVMVYGEYLQAPQIELASFLASVTPPSLSVTYFTNSGAEAVEGALKTARKATGRTGIIAFDQSYHGDTMGAMSVMGQQAMRTPFEPLLPGVRFLPWGREEALTAIDSDAAAVIIEPIQAEGGVRLPPPQFLQQLRDRCSATGSLLIVDEVVTGFGRTGRLFATEHWNIEPDLLVLAKAMGGGMPLGGFIGRPDIMATLAHDPPLSHLTTFGGHPVSCAAGLASLRLIVDTRLADRARAAGQLIQQELDALVGRGGLQSIRGMGLLIGLEFESPEQCLSFVIGCRRQGLLLGWTLYDDHVVRLAPPLTITPRELDLGLSRMKTVLSQSATTS